MDHAPAAHIYMLSSRPPAFINLFQIMYDSVVDAVSERPVFNDVVDKLHGPVRQSHISSIAPLTTYCRSYFQPYC